MRCFTMVMVTTSIKIDNDKRELAKKRGLVLTDLLDNALDMALGIELKETTQLQKEKEDLLESKKILIKEKEDFLKDHESKLLEIDFKLKNIDKALESAIIEDKEETKEREYKILANMVYDEGDLYRNHEIVQIVDAFADRYEMSKTEYEELKERLIDDLTNLFIDGKYRVKGRFKYNNITQELLYEE